MYFADIVCKDCGEIFEIIKNTIEEDFIISTCPVCKSQNTARKYRAVTTSVSEGLLGNHRNGYANGMTYHPNAIVGRVKGKRIK